MSFRWLAAGAFAVIASMSLLYYIKGVHTPLAVAQATTTGSCITPQQLKIAVVGDYGACTEHPDKCLWESAVARHLVAANPDLVIFVGDTNYAHGQAGPLEYPPNTSPPGTGPAHISNNNIRAFPLSDFPAPHETLSPPSAAGTPAAAAFPPSPPDPSGVGVELYEKYILSGRYLVAYGNHDYHQAGAGPAKAFFKQPGIGTSIQIGPVEFFVIDTNQISQRSPDRDSKVVGAPNLLNQRDEIIKKVNKSKACWKVLYMHHSATSRSDGHPVDEEYREMIEDIKQATSDKVDAVVFGHIHAFEYSKISDQDPTNFFLVGTGGEYPHPLDRPKGAKRIYKDDSVRHWGFLMVTATAGDQSGAGASMKFDWVATGDYGTIDTAWPQKFGEPWTTTFGPIFKNCSAFVSECQFSGTCIREWNTRTEYTECSPEPGCFDQIEVETTFGHKCPEIDALIRARVEADVCCISPPCVNYNCPAVARAYDCQGNLIHTMCLVPYWPYYTYQGETDCIFDRFSVPCRWEIEIKDEFKDEFEVKCPAKVTYFCCLDCNRNYEFSQQ